MTQENVDVDVPISMDDIRKVLNRDAKFALQVQNAALNRTVLELTRRLDTAMAELYDASGESGWEPQRADSIGDLNRDAMKDTKGKKGG